VVNGAEGNGDEWIMMTAEKPSNRNPLHLIECNLIAGAITELGGARAFVRRHGSK
jgi:hypothetical protein